MRQVMTIVGTDGSGKTTVATELVSRLRAQGVDATREWLGAESYLMAPVRLGLRLFWQRRSRESQPEQGSDYRDEVSGKNALAARHGWASKIYVRLVMADYWLQLRVKLHRNRRRDLVVADRYLFDVVVNLALALGWSVAQAIQYTQTQLWRFPMPILGVLVRVSPEVSMSRKDDIPDIEYVRLRASYYEAIALAFGFSVIDGTRPVGESAAILQRMVERQLRTPSVHYVHSNNEDVGGADLVLVSMAEHMRKWGDGCRAMVHLRLPTRAALAHADAGTPVAISSFVRPQVSSGLVGVARLILGGPVTVAHFWRIFGRERPSIVHVNDLYDFLPAVAARLRGIPVVFHIRMIKTGRMRRVFAYLLPRVATTVISVSHAVRQAYSSAKSPVGGSLVVHDLGNPRLVDHTESIAEPGPRPAGIPAEGRLVAMVGRLEPWKGQHVLLQAIELLPAAVRNGNTFVVVGGRVPGKEKYAERFEGEAQRLGVHYVGARTDVPDILLAADVSIHCSVEPDPFPGVVIESLLAGAATVAVGAGGVLEMIDRPEVGLLYEPGDFVALAGIIEALLTSPVCPRERYGAAGRRRAQELVSASVVDGQLGSVYESLATGSSQHSRSGLSRVSGNPEEAA